MFDLSKLKDCAGFSALNRVENFIKLLRENEVTFRNLNEKVEFEKNGRVLQAHYLDDRIAMFELLTRNKFIDKDIENLEEMI